MKRIALTAGIFLALIAPVGAQTYPQTTTVTQTITPTTVVTLKVTPTTNILTVEANDTRRGGTRRHAVARSHPRGSPPVIGPVPQGAEPVRSHEAILVTSH